ncbi:MAG TPA: class I SAM-dependent methyltransferase [Myxococcota bacterium]|nr:class I SAM-dependent methyltransferase [Myxococcota bacterium]
MMEGSVRCLLGCDAKVVPLAASGAAAHYLRCQQCGLVYEAHPAEKEDIARQYRDDLSSPSEYYTRSADEDRVTFRRRLRLLTAFRPRRGRLLDVGCSVGTLMDEARRLGWDVAGIEPNPRAASLAGRLDLPVVEGFFEPDEIEKPDKGYDCVVLNDVLEHLPDPARALRLVHGILAPGGLVMAGTPNMQSVWCRAFQLKPGEHLYLFNSDNLRVIFESIGFSICHLTSTSRRRALSRLDFSTTRLPSSLRILLGALGRLRLDGLLSRMMEEVFRDELLVIARKTST